MSYTADELNDNFIALLEFCYEVAKGPYKDSDIESLYTTHVARARAILKQFNKEEGA